MEGFGAAVGSDFADDAAGVDEEGLAVAAARGLKLFRGVKRRSRRASVSIVWVPEVNDLPFAVAVIVRIGGNIVVDLCVAAAAAAAATASTAATAAGLVVASGSSMSLSPAIAEVVAASAGLARTPMERDPIFGIAPPSGRTKGVRCGGGGQPPVSVNNCSCSRWCWRYCADLSTRGFSGVCVLQAPPLFGSFWRPGLTCRSFRSAVVAHTVCFLGFLQASPRES